MLTLFPVTLPERIPAPNHTSSSNLMKLSGSAVTIHHVAAAAGVSVSTVSRVLNNKGDVAAATQTKVQQAIADLGYSSSLAANQYAA